MLSAVIGIPPEYIEGQISVIPLRKLHRKTFQISLLNLKRSAPSFRILSPISVVWKPQYQIIYRGNYEDRLYRYLSTRQAVFPINLGVHWAHASISSVRKLAAQEVHSSYVDSALYLTPSLLPQYPLQYDTAIVEEADGYSIYVGYPLMFKESVPVLLDVEGHRHFVLFDLEEIADA